MTPGARKHKMIRDSSIKIIKNYNNLDLDVYDKHITDFQRYSGEIFEHDDNIFPPMKVDPVDAAQAKLQRSLANEYQIIEKFLKGIEGENANITPNRINKLLKYLPPFQRDTVPQANIDAFTDRGALGWTFLA